MTNFIPIITLACFILFAAACSDTTTEEKLPNGTLSSSERQSDPADQGSDEPITDEPTTDEPTTDEPVSDAERSRIPGMTYVLPEGWSVGPEKQMRLLTLLPPAEFEGVELAIAKWPGDVGGFSLNVARWARQAGVAMDPAALASLPRAEVDGTTSTYVPLVNKDANTAILAYWVPRGENPEQPTETWTFKLTSSAEQAIKLEPALQAWAKSVKFE